MHVGTENSTASTSGQMHLIKEQKLGERTLPHKTRVFYQLPDLQIAPLFQTDTSGSHLSALSKFQQLTGCHFM